MTSKTALAMVCSSVWLGGGGRSREGGIRPVVRTSALTARQGEKGTVTAPAASAA